MTTTTRSRKAAKSTNELHYIARAQFKATGAILYGVQSGENIYHVTIIKGRVTGCCNATTGEDCKGFHYGNGQCKHATYVLGLESERQAALPVAVRDMGGRTAHLDLGDHREVVRTCELPRLFPNGYRMIEKDDPERDAWNERMSQLEDRSSEGVADAAWIAQVRTCLPEHKSDIVTDDDMTAHIEDSIESGELDWIDEQRAAWANATPDERRAMYSNTFDLSYGDVA